MVDRRDVDRLVDRQKEAVELALAELREEFGGWDLSDPAAVREAILEYVPMLVSEYGDIAADAAARWYEEVRPGEGFTARTVAPAPASDVLEDLGYFTDGLDGRRAPDIVATISGAVQRHIAYSSRETIARNVELDPLEPRFARVPSGAHTCAWCEMLSSRGFVYRSRESAGEIARFHDNDDCQIVPEWEAERAHLEGYDPDAAYERYLAARGQLEEAGNRAPTDREVAAQMREMFPTKYTDAGTKQIIAAGIPDASDADGVRRYWQARQDNLRAGDIGEVLQPHEIEFYERFKEAGNRFRLIARDRETFTSTNDFLWTYRGNRKVDLEVEAKSTQAAYQSVKNHIKGAVTRAGRHGVTKENFVIELPRPMTDKLRRQLEQYNRRVSTAQIRRLWVLVDGVLEEIRLQ